MKSRILWALVLVAALAGFYYATIRPAWEPAPARLPRKPLIKEFTPPEIAPPPLPQPVVAMPVIAPPPLPAAAPVALPPPVRVRPRSADVPIQNGVTIDFSYGTAQVKTQGDDQAALDRALKEIAEATKNTIFAPAPTVPTPPVPPVPPPDKP